MDDRNIVIGMSGGVDSSVAAYILAEAGYSLTGHKDLLCKLLL